MLKSGGRLAGLALVSAALQPVEGRPLARPAVGSRAHRRRAPDPLALCVYDVFWLLSFGLYVPVPAPLAPPFLRGLRPGKVFSGAPSSLISSEDFPGLALRVDGPARAQLRKLRQQPKNNGGEGSWPVT